MKPPKETISKIADGKGENIENSDKAAASAATESRFQSC